MLLTVPSSTPARARCLSEFRPSGSRASSRDPVMTPPVRRYDRTQRVRTSREYAEVKANGVAVRGQHCLLLALAKPAEPTRIGFITSKKGVGNAVERNRARRRLREIVRVRWPRVASTGYWLVLIAYRTSRTAPHQDLANDVERVLAVAGALSPIGKVEA